MKQHPVFANILVRGLRNPLTYAIPAHLEQVQIGHEVSIELKNRVERGWVISTSTTPPQVAEEETQKSSPQQSLFNADSMQRRIKVKDIITSHPAFCPDDLPFLNWISDYYAAPLSEVLENAVPKAQAHRKSFSFSASPILISQQESLLPGLKKKAPKQYEVAAWLLAQEGSSRGFRDIDEHFSTNSQKRALAQLIEKGLVTKEEYTPYPETQQTKAPELTPAQTSAVSTLQTQLSESRFFTDLLFGITGSGKTEVYIRAIKEALRLGGSALLIVPEIALTPQVVRRFSERFTEPISILHSKIGQGEKWREWNKILSGERKIVIGARSAIFAPLQNLKIIVVDEEHETSYKQGDGLRYNARDLAITKARIQNCIALLGSATPSFETLYNTQRGKYSLLELPERTSTAKLPSMSVVNLRTTPQKKMASPNISLQLKEAIEDNISRGEQTILFYNRRGFASFLQCTTCGKVVECPHCAVTLTFYGTQNLLKCHYCNHTQKTLEKCPVCTDTSQIIIEGGKTKHKKNIGTLTPRGSGTEKVVDEILELFPAARIDRMDRESTSKKNSMESILDRVHSGETDILIGTQMLAKGHDLPKVTLVGLIDADVGLHFPDFRSSERAYQIIVQASGRAGRGTLPGRVIIQTREPEHPTIVAAVTGRFKAFVRFELEFRKQLDYPPLSRLARVVISSQDKYLAEKASIHLLQYIESAQNSEKSEENIGLWKTLGPAKAPIEKIKNRHRWHMLIKSRSPRTLSIISNMISSWASQQKIDSGLRVSIDVDPLDML